MDYQHYLFLLLSSTQWTIQWLGDLPSFTRPRASFNIPATLATSWSACRFSSRTREPVMGYQWSVRFCSMENGPCIDDYLDHYRLDYYNNILIFDDRTWCFTSPFLKDTPSTNLTCFSMDMCAPWSVVKPTINQPQFSRKSIGNSEIGFIYVAPWRT
jgi:hypothetical protein